LTITYRTKREIAKFEDVCIKDKRLNRGKKGARRQLQLKGGRLVNSGRGKEGKTKA